MSAYHLASRCAAAALALALASEVKAELLVGDYLGAGGAPAILRYADSAAGAATPLGSFYTNGGGNVLHSTLGMTFEPVENVVYVADYDDQAIRVYANGTSGNASPLRTLNPALLGQPRQIAVNTVHDELIIANGCCVITYGRYTSGNQVNPSRYLASSNTNEGSRTRLNNPGGVVLRLSTDEIVIPDTGVGAGNASFGVVLFFPRALTGNSSPYRTLEGALTLLGTSAFGISYDALHDELYVLSQDASTYPYGYRISTFAGSASGNVAPSRSISGDNALLADVHTIFYDDAAETLYASVGGENGVPARILAFARGANGNVAPDRSIVPNGGSFTLPLGMTATCDCIFSNGFN